MPARVTDLARTAASINRDVAIQAETSFAGIDDDVLRYASTLTRKQAFKTVDGKKGAGIHCKASVSTLTGLVGALHFSQRREDVPTNLASLACSIAGVSSESSALLSKFQGFFHCMDQSYATKEALKWVLSDNVQGRVLSSQKKTKFMPVKKANEPVSTGTIGYSMPSSGIREAATFRL